MAAIIYDGDAIFKYGAQVDWIYTFFNSRNKLEANSITFLDADANSNTLDAGKYGKINFKQFSSLASSDPAQLRDVVATIANNYGLYAGANKGKDFKIDYSTFGNFHYQLDQKVETKTPASGENCTVDNSRGTISLATSCTLSAQYQEAISASTTEGWSNAIAVKIGAKVAFSDKFSLSVDITNTFTYSSSSTNTQTSSKSDIYSATAGVTVPPGQQTELQLIYAVDQVDIPFSGTFLATTGETGPNGKINQLTFGSTDKGFSPYQDSLSNIAYYAYSYGMEPGSDPSLIQKYNDDPNDGTTQITGTGTLSGLSGTGFNIIQVPVKTLGDLPTTSVPEPTLVPGLALFAILLGCWKLLNRRTLGSASSSE